MYLKICKHTLTAEYNNLDSVKKLFEEFPNDIACVIIEPVAGNMNCVPPKEGFLQGIREICDKYGALFIIDEVMTGFRVSLAGAQAYYGVTPDLTTLGKVIGGGMPVGAVGGKKVIYATPCTDRSGLPSWHPFWNPIAMLQVLACLTELKKLVTNNILRN